MNSLRLALIAGVVALLVGSESQAQTATQIKPDGGYAVQALAYYKPNSGLPGGYFWYTVDTFETLEAAEDYEDFLMFLAFVDFNKLQGELDHVPNYIYLTWYDYRVVPLYSSRQLIPQSSSPLRASSLSEAQLRR